MAAAEPDQMSAPIGSMDTDMDMDLAPPAPPPPFAEEDGITVRDNLYSASN